LDVGCGKLRYLQEMRETTEHLVVTDSDIQLNRNQKLLGQDDISVKELARAANDWSVQRLNEAFQPKTYDRVFCLNVLQVIPFEKVRRRILSRIRECLSDRGELLLCVQYRNSDFTRMKDLHYAQEYRDGMLLKSLRGFSFYAFLYPDVINSYVIEAGFENVSFFLYDGTCYLTATAGR
jgi:hypothetical protein